MKKIKKLLLSTTTILFAAIIFNGCASPTNEPEKDEEKKEEVKKEEVLEDKYLDRKIEIFNKMLGDWESEFISEGNWKTVTNYSAGRYKEILRIEPKKWTLSIEGKEDVVLKTWDEPFYKYMYVYEEYTQNGFSNDKHKLFERAEENELYKLKDTVYLYIENFVGQNAANSFIGTSKIDTQISFNALSRFLVRSKKTDDTKKEEKEEENYNISGSWNYAVPGEPNAGGTVTFDNGNIKFKHKTGSLTTEATYTIKGKNIEISYRYNTEQFIISETDSNTITLKYQGRSSYSQILGLYFETSNQSITLTKGSETGNGNESDNDNGNASGNLGLVGKWRVSQQQNLIYNIIEFYENGTGKVWNSNYPNNGSNTFSWEITTSNTMKTKNMMGQIGYATYSLNGTSLELTNFIGYSGTVYLNKI